MRYRLGAIHDSIIPLTFTRLRRASPLPHWGEREPKGWFSDSLSPPFAVVRAFFGSPVATSRTGAGLYADLLNLSFSFAREMVSHRMTTRSHAPR
jgi:hypothetical protein